MRIKTSLILVGLLVQVGILSAQQGPAPDEQLLRLDGHLEKVFQEAKSNREWGGGLLVGTGVLVGAGGYVLAEGTSSGSTDWKNAVAGASLGAGAVLAGAGVLSLFLKTDFEKDPEVFLSRPEISPEEQRRKVIEGELTLQNLSDKARFNRLLGAGTEGVIGGALLATCFTGGTQGSSGGSSVSANLYTGLVYLGCAVLSCFLPSGPERENEAYLQWKASAGLK